MLTLSAETRAVFIVRLHVTPTRSLVAHHCVFLGFRMCGRHWQSRLYASYLPSLFRLPTSILRDAAPPYGVDEVSAASFGILTSMMRKFESGPSRFIRHRPEEAKALFEILLDRLGELGRSPLSVYNQVSPTPQRPVLHLEVVVDQT
jgi:hypothetical protein